MSWYIAVLKKYAVFSGRARRKEYWMWVLFNFIIMILLGMLEGMLGLFPETNESILVNIYYLGILVPYIAVSVRRMHDVGKRGWFILIPIYNLILCVTKGDEGDNQFGPNPKI